MTVTERAVAVVMTCYNEGLYIGAAVRSVLDQIRIDQVEAIVIADDGSSADTVAVLRQIETWDPRITVLYGPGGAGLPAQRNLAISHTRAPFIAILDGDDLWTTDKLQQQLGVIAADDRIGLVYSGYCTFPGENLAAANRAPVLDLSRARDLTLAYFLNDPPIIPSTTLIRRSAFERCGRFDAGIRTFEDTDFYLRLSRVCSFAFVERPLLYKRNHSASITGQRKDLMTHHALVAFKAAADEPRLLPLVPRRLAERARKLGNHRFLLGDRAEAQRLLSLAVRLDVRNVQAWASWFTVRFLGRIIGPLLAPRLRARRAALGVASDT